MSKNPIKATSYMKEIMKNYFLELNEASKNKDKKVAWCTSVGPAELLRSLGFFVYFPENHGAMLGATRSASDYIPVANSIGYSPDICSYLTSDIGAFLKGETPLTKAYGISTIPKPDILVFNTNQCRDVQDWLSFYARKFNVPIVGINTPRAVGNVQNFHIQDVAKQMEELIPQLEDISRNKFDIDKLREVVSLSLKCSNLWRDVLFTAKEMPSPITFFDGTIHMGPAVVLRGTQNAVDYYKLLLDELRKRIAKKIGAVENEKHRIYWEGMPIWGKLRELSQEFYDVNTCVVASTYCNSWIFEAFDPARPFLSMAKAYTELFIVRTDEHKEKYIENLCREFNADGIVFHDSKTCPYNTNSRYGMPERLQQKLNIPTLTINADLNDLRCYSAEQTKTNIQAFAEQLQK